MKVPQADFDIYIDADACPVKEDTFRIAKRYSLVVYVVSRVAIFLPKADWIRPMIAGDGFDAVDDVIEAKVKKDDIVITGDIPLSARCVEKGAMIVSPSGRVLDHENIGEAVAMRELMSELRQRGEIGLGPPKRGKKHDSNFNSALDQLINAILKKRR